MPKVEFLFDFGSPNAYLCHRVLPQIERRTGTLVEYVPILLGGLFKLSNNRSPVEANAQIPNKQAYEMLEIHRFVAAHGLSAFRMNPHFPVNTLQLMRGAVAAQALGCSPAYVEAMFAARWEQGRDMALPAEVQAVLAGAGLDAEALAAAAAGTPAKEGLKANTESAFRRGAFGSPTFFVDGEMYFGKDRLRDVEAAILAGGA
jgi:2-hydroxychromene-2-carboxylate isomerase